MLDLSQVSTIDLCRLGGALAFNVDNALTLTVIQSHGHEVAEEIQFRVLRSHQQHMFLNGLQKLGLDQESSDAIRCAKFHVLSNHLGGLRVRYAEESNDKAWVVYDTPYWVDSPWTPSMSPAVMRPQMLLRTMEAWHANNWSFLKNDGLQYVQAELVTSGGVCDAGYFLDTHRKLRDDERLLVRLDEGLPTGLKLEPIKPSETEWPLERQAKAWRNFSVAYVGGRLFWMIEVLGRDEATRLFEHAYRIALLQNREKIPASLGINTPPNTTRAAQLWAAWHQSWGDEVVFDTISDTAIDGVILRSRIHEVGEFTPPGTPIPVSIETATARAWASLINYDCPGVSISCSGSMAADSGWCFKFRQ